MPSLKAIRKRIASTKATQKITRAMKMVAGAKLTRAQQRIVALRPYAVKTAEVLESVAATVGSSAESGDEPGHPLLVTVDEMRKAAKLQVKAASKKGNLTTDTYSLVGFSQALERVQKDCPAN